MAKEAMEAILAAERAASQCLSEAKSKAIECVEQAKNQAKIRQADILKSAELTVLKAKELAHQEATETGEPILNAAAKQAERYASLRSEDLDAMAQYVVKQVMDYGNR